MQQQMQQMPAYCRLRRWRWRWWACRWIWRSSRAFLKKNSWFFDLECFVAEAREERWAAGARCLPIPWQRLDLIWRILQQQARGCTEASSTSSLFGIVCPTTAEEAASYLAEFSRAGFLVCIASSEATHSYQFRQNHLSGKTVLTTRTFDLTSPSDFVHYSSLSWQMEWQNLSSTL